MTTPAQARIRLTSKARAALRPRPIPEWCSSLWGDNPRHQCVRPPNHDGGCVCSCGEPR